MLDLGDIVSNSNKPDPIEFIWYLFWEKGISLEQFNKLPIPYILSIVNTHTYMKKEEEKAYKKANKK